MRITLNRAVILPLRFHSMRTILLCAGALTLAAASAFAGPAKSSAPPPPPSFAATCMGGMMLPTGNGQDVKITGLCKVGAGEYTYGNINIFRGGRLVFLDEKIDLWATSILIERDGVLEAGSPDAPIGANGGKLTIHLYGANQGLNGKGIVCQYDVHCGVPTGIWGTNGSKKVDLPGGVNDYFYDYQPLKYDGGDANGYFGYKVLGVSYGGSLLLYGEDGASYPKEGDLMPYDSGMSWARLTESVPVGGTTLTLDRKVNWQDGDRIVLTTTDYVSSHSEPMTVAKVDNDGDTSIVTVNEQAVFPHNGQRYSLDDLPAGLGPDPAPTQPADAGKSAETRAAVALLSRSIRIVSAGNNPGNEFPAAESGYYFGGHTVFRQGFEKIDVHGVEFYQMGQGGRIMHYPVHFHMARKTPADTTVADCTVDDSMTRWITLHATQGVTLERNVGYLSIGHGYYTEDGTETDNRLYSNIGIEVRAAVQNKTVNPRNVPGILAARYPAWNDKDEPQELVPFHSDIDHPTVFWIMNGWNDFEYNMAAGADTCGACYWLVPGYNSGMSRMEKWESYASEQVGSARAATTPLYKFVGNYCSTAMNAFNTIGNTTKCTPVVNNDPSAMLPRLEPVTENDLAPAPFSAEADSYYPKVDTGGGRFATLCPSGLENNDCSKALKCANKAEANCAVTVLDHFTTSFNWAETNFAAVWLRPQWYLMTNSVITDVQNGGLSFITGGGYTQSDVISGYWALAYKNAFIGNTQEPAKAPNNFASNAGPFNPDTPLRCEKKSNGSAAISFCMDRDNALIFLLSNFAVNQRFFNIYDGPSYEDSNAYVHIVPTTLTDCKPSPPPYGGQCDQTDWMYGQVTGVTQRRNMTQPCYLPNAAIGWKQPNGFYYPPAFHSTNLFFKDVPIRHFVIEPLFLPGTFKIDVNAAATRYCNWNDGIFNSFTDVDRQTELNDDDGSLTGQIQTISVNEDPFFSAPVEEIECGSDVPEFTPPGTAKTSPYDYVTTAMYPGCGRDCGKYWASDCTHSNCYGVPLYREDVNPNEKGTKPNIRMMGQDIAQRSNMTVNNGRFYIDTTASATKQLGSGATNLNLFQAGQTYYTFLLFAKPATLQEYSMYVGPGFDDNDDNQLYAVRVDTTTKDLKFPSTDWPSTWTHSYNKDLGLLTVKMNMSFPEFKVNYDAAKAGDCAPKSFCTLDDEDDSCGCSLKDTDPLYADCQHACSNWAGRDVDCPDNDSKPGCYGFAVKLTDGFTVGNKTGLPPATDCFPDNTLWNTPFMPATEDVAGTCYDPTPPKGKFCSQDSGLRSVSKN